VRLQSFIADADGGHLPGMAGTGGVGATASHLAMAAAPGAHGVSELRHDSVYADAARLGDSSAKQVASASTERGWLSATAAN
jgi:hypothetical protein